MDVQAPLASAELTYGVERGKAPQLLELRLGGRFASCKGDDEAQFGGFAGALLCVHIDSVCRVSRRVEQGMPLPGQRFLEPYMRLRWQGNELPGHIDDNHHVVREQLCTAVHESSCCGALASTTWPEDDGSHAVHGNCRAVQDHMAVEQVEEDEGLLVKSMNAVGLKLMALQVDTTVTGHRDGYPGGRVR